MPEGPEVTHLCQILNRALVGEQVQNIEVVRGRYKTHSKPQNFDIFVSLLPMKCIQVQKKGKVLFLYFEKNWCIVSKLGLTGWWYTETNLPKWRKMDPNVVFTLKSDKKVFFSDLLSYGTLSFYNSKELVDKEIMQLAPDIIDESTTLKVLKNQVRAIRNKKSLIEDAIIDQRLIVSGIGNYLKSEILYDAKISPYRKLEDLSDDNWICLFRSMKKITKQMLKSLQADNIDTYVNSMQVYKKETDKHGNQVVKKLSKNRRVTYWVQSQQT